MKWKKIGLGYENFKEFVDVCIKLNPESIVDYYLILNC